MSKVDRVGRNDPRDEYESLRDLYLRAMDSAGATPDRGGIAVKPRTTLRDLSLSASQVGAPNDSIVRNTRRAKAIVELRTGDAVLR